MGIIDSLAYKSLKTELDRSHELGVNLLIITVPGTGLGRLLTEYKRKGKMTILRLDWADEKALGVAEELFKKLSPEDKVAVTFNYPGKLRENKIKTSYFLNHCYRKYYFGLRNKEDSIRLVKEIDEGIGEEKETEIYRLSGGLAQLIKYLAVNGTESRDGIEAILRPLLEATSQLSEEERKSLNIGGELLAEIENKGRRIKVGFDLSLEEDGEKSKEKLSAGEKEILEKMIKNGGTITKEEVSDLKWGMGKYEEFSDQAINKTMRRLSAKLEKHFIETVPKIGFILKRKQI